MVSTVANFFTTIFLTILASTTLVITYRYALRPVLVRHNIIPLQHLPSTISQHLANRRRGHVRLPSEDFDEDPAEWNEREGALSRDLEDGFGVYRDSDDEAPAQAKAKGDRSEGEHRSQAEAERETLL